MRRIDDSIMLKVRLQRISRVMVIIVAVTILILSLLPREAIKNVSQPDKLLHFTAYANLSFLACFSFIKSINIKLILIIILACFVYGAVIEFLQPLVGRNKDNMDMLVNAAGVVAGTTFCVFLDLFLSKIRRKLFRQNKNLILK